jgi:hypothetical protein
MTKLHHQLITPVPTHRQPASSLLTPRVLLSMPVSCPARGTSPPPQRCCPRLQRLALDRCLLLQLDQPADGRKPATLATP